MTSAWKSNFLSGKKLVLLALCDNANDQGECFPSVSMLAEKCSLSERSVFNHIADLEKDGAISRQNRAGRSTVYQLNPCKFCTPTPATVAGVSNQTPANSAPLPLQILHPTPATVSPTPANSAPITIKEPSINQIPDTKYKAQAPSVLPDWIPVDSWDGFMQTRKKKKAADTPFALSLILKDLTRFHEAGHNVGEILNRSIKGGWTDVYEPKTGQNRVQKTSNKHTGFKQLDYREGIEEDGTFA